MDGARLIARRRMVPLALALLIGGAAAAPAFAQFNPFVQRPAESGALTRDDIDRMKAATERLYTGRSIGTTERWRDPDSGNSGSVKLIRAFKTKGMDCRRMRYKVKLRGSSADPAPYFVNWCQTPSGEWKTLEPGPVQ